MADPRCFPPRTPFVGSGRQPEGGFLAVHKRDFNAHVSGVAFRHCADQINMNPPLDTIPGENVQEVLENIETSLGGIGGMFVTVGIEGGTEGDYNVGATYTTLQAALNAAFADSQVATTGGVVVILAGDYTITSTVTIPAGIMLWGENGGVIIDGVMSNEPIFIIETADSAKKLLIGYDNVDQVDAQLSVQSTKLFGMTLVDNRSRTGSGIPGMTSVPMVACQRGCNVLFDQVTFLGSINSNTNSTTYRAIGFNEDVTSNDGTSVIITHCVIDGVSSAIEFRGNNGKNDFFEVNNCRIRYFGEASGTGENNAIYTTFCNAQIENNRINGYYLAGVFAPSSAIRINTASVSDDDVRFNVLNNSGDSNNPSDAAQLRFIELDSAVSTVSVLKGLTARGNNWGESYGSTDFEIIVGNDEYIGDINGTGALDLVIDRSATESTTRAQFTVYVLPGTYTITNSGTSVGGPRLIGLPARNDTVNVVLGSALSSSDLLGRKTVYLGRELRNIIFSGSSAGEFPSVQMIAPNNTEIGNNDTIIDNCSFVNCSLTFYVSGSIAQNQQNSLLVHNTIFRQSGLYDNNLSLWIPNSYWNNVDISRCIFEGAGYMLFVGTDWRGITSSTGIKIKVSDCNFDFSAFSGGPISDALPSPWDQNQHKYIFINDINADFKMENCTLTHSRTIYDLLDQSQLNADLFDSYVDTDETKLASSFIRLCARNIVIRNVTAKGNWQRKETTNQLVAYMDLLPVHRLSIIETSIEAGFPIHLYSFDEDDLGSLPRGSLETTPVYLVDSCSFFQPNIDPGFDSVTIFYMYLRSCSSFFDWSLSSDLLATIPSVTVRNCSIQQTKKPIGSTLSDLAYPAESGTQGKTLAETMVVSANGWHMTICDNTILSKHPEYEFAYAGLSLWNQSFAGTQNFIWNTKSTISGNKITCYSQTSISGSFGSTSYKSVAVFLQWAQTAFINNVIQYIIDADGTTNPAFAPTGDNRGFMYLRHHWVTTPSGVAKNYQEAILIISNNTFINSGDLRNYAFWIEDDGSGNANTSVSCDALFSNNVIGEDAPSLSLQRHWFNRVPHYWKVRLDKTNNTTNGVAGYAVVASPSYNRPYESAEITYYLWNSEPYDNI